MSCHELARAAKLQFYHIGTFNCLVFQLYCKSASSGITRPVITQNAWMKFLRFCRRYQIDEEDGISIFTLIFGTLRKLEFFFQSFPRRDNILGAWFAGAFVHLYCFGGVIYLKGSIFWQLYVCVFIIFRVPPFSSWPWRMPHTGPLMRGGFAGWKIFYSRWGSRVVRLVAWVIESAHMSTKNYFLR